MARISPFSRRTVISRPRRCAILGGATGHAAQDRAKQARCDGAVAAADRAAGGNTTDRATGKRADARGFALDHDFTHAFHHAEAHGLLALSLAARVDAVGVGLGGTPGKQRRRCEHGDAADT